VEVQLEYLLKISDLSSRDEQRALATIVSPCRKQECCRALRPECSRALRSFRKVGFRWIV